MDFALDEGIASIIGPNGAGKTTLFNVFTGLYVPDEGQRDLPRHAAARPRPDQITALGICRTFQNIRLFANMTAVENVLVGMHARVPLGCGTCSPAAALSRTESGLWVGAAGRAARAWSACAPRPTRSPATCPTAISGGWRSAARSPPSPALLLLDEPTAGMTQGEARHLMALLRRLVGDLDLTILLIEHNMRVVMEVSDRVTVLDHGEKIAEGQPRRRPAQPRVIEAYLGRSGAPARGAGLTPC